MAEFEPTAALVAGFAGTVVMTALMQMSAAAGLTGMPPMPLVMGSMVSGDRSTATGIGTAIHLMMGTVLFGLAYAAAFTAVGGSVDAATVAADDRGELRLSAPGVLGKDWGGMTPVGMLMGHAAYGSVLALVYGWVAA
ncbi:MAG: hypothetical protein KY443_08230 [Actinobacteria bacterium]|nr:hypothetical protein [Actinomycetota bacterium]